MDASTESSGNFGYTGALRSMRTTYLMLIALYLLAMIWVWAGIFYASDGGYAGYAALLAIGFGCTVVIFYFLLFPIFHPISEIDLRIPGDAIAIALIFVVIGLAAVHWLELGRIPIIAAFGTDDTMQAALIRDSIAQADVPLLNYIPTIVIRSVAPFLGVYFISRRRYRLAWIAMIIGLLYGVSLMQKSYPLMILVPPALYCLLTRHPVRMAGIMTLAVTGVLLSFFAASPPYRPIKTALLFHTEQPALTPQQDQQRVPAPPRPTKNLGKIAGVTTSSLASRVFLLPGKVVADWFSIFPNKLSYEDGCGYRFVAPFIGCAFVNTSVRTYEYLFPKYAKAGLHGTYNAAHFAEEYANFGLIGLFFSGLLVAIALAVAAVATGRAGLAAVTALNFAPIMALTSSDLHTTLLSGGWILMMALAFALYPPARMRREAMVRKSPGKSDAAAISHEEMMDQAAA